jgi:hypothetical protein
MVQVGATAADKRYGLEIGELFQVIAGDDQQQPKVEHQAEVLGYSRDNGTEVLQVGDEEHYQANDK